MNTAKPSATCASSSTTGIRRATTIDRLKLASPETQSLLAFAGGAAWPDGGFAGGFGGITYDVARVLGVPGLPAWPVATDAAGLDEVRLLVSSGGYTGLHNGLSEQENLWLTTTHRPSEIAALVSRGLRRVLGDQWPAVPTMGGGSGRGTEAWDG